MTNSRTSTFFRLSGVIAAVFGCAISLEAVAADPAVGSWSKFTCTGPYDSEYRYELKELNGSVMSVDVERDGKAGWVKRSRDHIGTTLFVSRDRGDGKGKRGQKLRGKFDGISDLVSGKTYSGRVDEWHRKAQWTWKYTITVGKREMIKHAVLGDVEVITISERRQVEGGSYRSSMKAVITTAKPRRTVGWDYTDEKGTQSCQLASVSSTSS